MADERDLLKAFLDDILTKKEFDACVLRLKAMCMIHDCVTYEQIRSATGLSPGTISRLSKIMRDYDCGTQQIVRKFEEKGSPYSE